MSRMKDTVVKDFFNDMPSYMKHISTDDFTFDEDMPFARIQEQYFKEGEQFTRFVECVFHRLGYDLSNLKESEELFGLVNSVFNTALQLGSTIQVLATDVNEDEQLRKLISKIEEADKDDIYSLFDEGAKWASSAGGWAEKTSAVFGLVKEMISLLKKFRDIEWDKIKEETGNFGVHLKDTVCERIFDYIIAVFLKNAKEVYADDIEALMQFVSDTKDEITQEIQFCKDEYQKLKDTAKKEITDLLNEAGETAKDIENELRAELRGGMKGLSLELQTRFRILKEELERNGIIDVYMEVSRICGRIYSVLSFCKVIVQERIDFAKFIPSVPTMSEVKSEQLRRANDEVNKIIDKAKELYLLTEDEKSQLKIGDWQNGINSVIGEFNSLVKNSEQAVREAMPTVNIYVIRWDKLEDLFSDPVEYFKGIYPLYSYEDAEMLMTEILGVARAFNSDIPDFKSLKRMLYDLLVRAENKISEGLEGEAAEALKQFKAFVNDLIAMLENITMNVLRQVRSGFDELEQAVSGTIEGLQKDNIWVELGTRIIEEIASLPGEGVYRDIRFFSHKSIAGNSEELASLFVNPLLRSVKKACGRYPVFKENGIKPFEQLFDSAKADGNGLVKSMTGILQEIEQYIRDLLSPNIYVSRFNDILRELKEEFDRQTRDIPRWKDSDDFKNFAGKKIKELASGKLSFPSISSLDFNEYFSIISDGIKSLVPSSPEIFAPKFRDAVETYFERLLGDAGELGALVDRGAEDCAGRIRSFTEEVFASFWTELAREVNRRFIRPYIDLIESLIKDWAINTLLPQAVESVCEIIGDNNIALGTDIVFLEKHDEATGYAADICNAAAHSPEADKIRQECRKHSDVVKELLQLVMDAGKLSEGAKKIDSWTDGLKFMFRVYQAIPKSVRRYLREIINLPGWNFDSIRLPDYRLDVRNKFLAVSVWHFEGETSDKDSETSGSVDIQLLAFIGPKQRGKEDEETRYGIYIIPAISGDLEHAQQIGDSHTLTLEAEVSLNKSGDSSADKEMKPAEMFENGLVGIFVSGTYPETPDIELLCSSDAVAANLKLIFGRGRTDGTSVEPFRFFDAKYASLTIDNYPQTFFIGYDKGFDVGYACELKDLELVLKLGQANAFMEKILREDIILRLESLKLGYSLKKGFDVEGDVMARIPFNTDLDLKAVRFKGLALEIGGSGGSVKAMVGMTFTADFKAVAFTFPNMAFGLDCNIIGADGKLGDFDFSPEFRYPSGIGISIDVSGIKGSGAINWDSEAQSFKGFLGLDIFGLFGASALLVFEMKKKDGTEGFSLFGAVSVLFTPGIQIGLGFSITRIGGSLGLNRELDVDKLRDATYDGTLASIAFIDDLDKNMDEVLANITVYYPAKEDQFFMGLMARIDWNKMFTVDAGIFIQMPDPVTFLIAGSFNMTLSEKVEKLLCIKVDFLGEIDIMKGILLDASIHDSYIAGISFYGDIALRILWGGDTKGFLISAGGFHPEYTPAQGFRVRDMKRLGMKLDYDILRLGLECYFAVTSNSVQFGAEANLLIGWKNKFDISGRLAFNVLFQWNPFYFSTDISLYVGVHVFGVRICGIDLEFALSGPAQWHAKGRASFWFIVKVGMDFSLKWGKKQGDSNRTRIDVKPLFVESFEDKTNANWRTLTSDLSDNLVSLGEIVSEGGIVVHPSESLSFCQDAIPLNMHLDQYGEEDINDFDRFDLQEITVGSTVFQERDILTVKTLFAPAQIKKMTNEDKLKSDPFIKVDGGFMLSGKMLEDVIARPAAIDLDTYEYFVRDMTPATLDLWKKFVSSNKSGSKKPVGKQKLGIPQRVTDAIIHKNIRTKKSSSNNRVSMRRNAEGFKRHVKRLDNYLKCDLESLVEQL